MEEIKQQEENPLTVDISRQSIWQQIKGAITGTEADYTKIDLNKAILLLAIPMVLELVLESTFALADIYFVSQLGASAVATVGLTESILYLLYSLSMGMSIAVTAIVARRVGQKLPEKAAVTAVQAIIIGMLFSFPFMIAGIFFSKDLLRLMGGDAWVLEEGYKYTQWMLGGNVVIVLLFVINAIFRGAGDAAIAMRILLISNGINIVLDPLFIFGLGPIPAMGIEGAAIATNIGRGVGVLAQFWLLFKGGKHIRVLKAHLVWRGKIILKILKTSLGGIGQMLVSMMSWLFITRIFAELGSEVVAGATITIRIIMFSMMPAWGMSNAAATLVGQNLGAGDSARAESSVWKIGVYNMVFLAIVSVVFFFYSRELVQLFTEDSKVIEVGAGWLKIISYSYIVYGWWMVAVQAFNGAGDTKTPTWINVIFFWMIQIPLAWLLGIHLDYTYTGVFWAVFISETAVGLFTLWLFTRGKWKTVSV
jgi:putative MATE family efflux protein